MPTFSDVASLLFKQPNAAQQALIQKLGIPADQVLTHNDVSRMAQAIIELQQYATNNLPGLRGPLFYSTSLAEAHYDSSTSTYYFLYDEIHYAPGEGNDADYGTQGLRPLAGYDFILADSGKLYRFVDYSEGHNYIVSLVTDLRGIRFWTTGVAYDYNVVDGDNLVSQDVLYRTDDNWQPPVFGDLFVDGNGYLCSVGESVDLGILGSFFKVYPLRNLKGPKGDPLPYSEWADSDKQALTEAATRKAEESAQQAASTLQELKEAMQQLPDGQAVSAQVAQNTTDLTDLAFKITDIKHRIEYLEGDMSNAMCIGAWDDSTLAATSVKTVGDKRFALAWYPWLIDHNGEVGENGGMKPVAQLMKNNWLRTVTGDFSPAVTVSEADYNAVDGKDLYQMVDGALVKLHDATSHFDHVEYYLVHGVEPLYDADGNELYVRKPWDTTSTDLSIMVGRKDTINVIDNMIGESGYKWRGVLSVQNTDYDGCHVAPFVLHPTAICPSPAGTVGNKTRSFFMAVSGIGDSNSRGESGMGGLCSVFKNDGLYPRSNDAQQINNMNWSRANNADTTAPYPFAEGGYHALNAFLCSLEAAYGTKYLHANSMFSSGTSSNDACSNESTWTNNGGVRFRMKGAAAWSYATLGTNTSFYYNASGSRTNWSETINCRRALWRVNEACIVASYASERHIAEHEVFTFMGNRYWYETPNGAKSLLEGEMNARIYRIAAFDINGYDANGDAVGYEVELIMRAGVMNGVDASGDIYSYWGGGYELVGNSTTNVITPYIQPDQKAWKRITGTTVAIGSEFGFEQDYIELTPVTASLTNSYTAKQDPFVPFYSKTGGSIGTGECHYVYGAKNWNSANNNVRIGVRFRGSATSTYCSARSLPANSHAGSTYRNYGCSAQCLLDVQQGAAPLQAE